MKIKFLSISLLFFTACNLTASNETEQYIKVNTSIILSLYIVIKARNFIVKFLL